MAKAQKKRMAKASISSVADRTARAQRDLLGRNVRNEKKIIQLQKQLTRAIARRELAMVDLHKFLDDWLGYTPREVAG